LRRRQELIDGHEVNLVEPHRVAHGHLLIRVADRIGEGYAERSGLVNSPF
jgi:hypothetical protein